MVLFILVQNKLCTLRIRLQFACGLNTSQKEESCRKAWRGDYQASMAKIYGCAIRNNSNLTWIRILWHPCRGQSHTHQKERRDELYICGTDCILSDPELLCYLEDGLLDPEGGQQNWCRTLSSLPRKRGGKKEKRQRNRIIGKSIRKIHLEIFFCF